jgi:DNA recombination protein RmuC
MARPGNEMQIDSLIVVVILLALGTAVVFLVLRMERRRAGQAVQAAQLAEMAQKLSEAQAALSGRMAQMAEGQQVAQAQLGERLQAQERALAKALDERLVAVTRQVGESLSKSSQTTQTTMTDLRERLVRIDAAQKNITELSAQMVGLQDILSNKQARGAFGQIQLNDLVKSVLPPSAYAFEVTLGNGKRADCLLTLPQPPGPIVIDAKFPLESYHALRNAADDSARKTASRQFTADMLKHVRDISEKYIVPGETAESALMFLPSEAVYAELHASFPNVVEQSYRERVFIVSPTTLWATLNTVRAVLKDARMREQAGVIQHEVLRLLTDVARLDKRVGNLQRHFDQASDDMREIRTSADKITKRGSKIEELQVEEARAETDEDAELEAPLAPPRDALEADAG